MKFSICTIVIACLASFVCASEKVDAGDNKKSEKSYQDEKVVYLQAITCNTTSSTNNNGTATMKKGPELSLAQSKLDTINKCITNHEDDAPKSKACLNDSRVDPKHIDILSKDHFEEPLKIVTPALSLSELFWFRSNFYYLILFEWESFKKTLLETDEN